MTRSESQSILSLGAILSLRMLGLFAVLPMLSLYVGEMKGVTPALAGIALGIYGLTQAVCQIPLGALSDRAGRKMIISLGLLIFISGSVIAALGTSLPTLILGRALQGAGAIGSTTMALLADLTHESHRTKAMAITGMTVGLSFSVALVIGPALVPYTGVRGIFWLAAFLGGLGLLILSTWVPRPTEQHTSLSLKGAFREMIRFPNLPPLYIGIFLLHTVFTASFVALPISLQHFAGLTENRQWILYVPTLLTAFLLSLALIASAERKRQPQPFFLLAILLMGIGELLLWEMHTSLWLAAAGLLLFFTGFSTLEAFIPSSVSRLAPKHRRGTALGIHSTAQFAGMFFGGMSGGWLYGHYGFSAVYIFCILTVFLWLMITHKIKVVTPAPVPLSTT